MLKLNIRGVGTLPGAWHIICTVVVFQAISIRVVKTDFGTVSLGEKIWHV